MKRKWLARFLAVALVVSALQQSESIVSAVEGADAVEVSDETQMPGETENMQVPEMEEESLEEMNAASMGETESLGFQETGGNEWTVESIEPGAKGETIAAENLDFPEEAKEQDAPETLEGGETGESTESTEGVQETEAPEADGGAIEENGNVGLWGDAGISDIPEAIGVAEAALESAEGENALVAYAEDIASGSYGDIVWVIDASGKLTVSGTGDYADPTVSAPAQSPWYEYRKKIISTEVNVTGMTNASYMFYGCGNMISADLDNFDTSNVTEMGFMFYGCSSLSSLDVSNFITDSVTNMEYMFYDCEQLTNLNVSNFDTSNVADMEDMFWRCSNLTSLDLSSFNTENVTGMCYMFYECENLASLDISSFNTRNVTDMRKMFYGCINLTSVDVSCFNTENVTDMLGMFHGCSNLTNLDLSSFDIGNVTDIDGMIYGCSNLTNLDLSSFDMSQIVEAPTMLMYCSSLVTVYSPYNLGMSIPLPAISGTSWHLIDGKEITELPRNLTESVVVSRTAKIVSPKITTTTADLNSRDVIRVKYIPYYYEVETDNTDEMNRITFSVSEGTLPSGLQMSSWGVISGVPKEAGDFAIKVEAKYSKETYEASYADLVISIQENTDANVNSASDLGYGIVTPVGERLESGSYILKQIDDQVFEVYAAEQGFMGLNALWLNGEKLDEGTDYSVETRNTKFVIFSQVFEMKASENPNTLVAEFLVDLNGWHGPMRAAQNLAINVQPDVTPEPSDDPMPEPSLAPSVEPTLEPSPEPSVEPTPEPSVEPSVEPVPELSPKPSIEPTLEPIVEPSVDPVPELSPEPSMEPTQSPEPGEELRIITTTPDLIMDDVVRVKYVPYSYTIETNNNYEGNTVTFSIESGRLAEGLLIYPATGEIYGVPMETGEFPIRVKATYSDPRFSPSYADITVTVIGNTNGNVFAASDVGYELLQPVGEQMENGEFVITRFVDRLFVSAGQFHEFIDLWLNGERLIDGVDYTKESGSTRITVMAQTFENKANREGVNTIAAEFRVDGDKSKKLKRTAQNFRIDIQQDNDADADNGGSDLDQSVNSSTGSVSETGDNISRDQTQTVSPQTGDEAKPGLWLVLAVISLGSGYGIYQYDKKKKRTESKD